MKLTVSKSKNSASFYVQKTIRKSNGSVTTVTIEKLGNIDEVKTKAKGKDPYLWAQEYVNELNRKEYEEQKEILVKYSPSKLLKNKQQKLYNCGYLFLQNIYNDLGLDKICKKISSKYNFDYDLNDILSKLVYTRIIYPSSKRSSNKKAKMFLEQPNFELHDIYRSLSILAQESDFIQSELYKNSQNVLERRKDILYYDCTNYYFEIERDDDLRKYGQSKQHQPLPLVGMGLFMDYDGVPLAFDIYPGNKNEQPTLKPLEKKILRDYGLEQIVVCTDAGLSSESNRRFNDKSIYGKRLRSFITTQSIKKLPEYLKDFSLSPEGWQLLGDDHIYDISKLDEESEYYNKIFYKESWIVGKQTKEEKKKGLKPLEQRLIVSFSLKYREYQRKTRQRQVERAYALINSGKYRKHSKNQNDPNRFIGYKLIAKDETDQPKEIPFLDIKIIAEEEKFDGFYAICTNLEKTGIEQIVKINKKRWEIEESFRILKTEFKARPIYLRNENRILAHFITCFIALFIFRILEKKLDDKYTCEEIISTLKSMVMARPGEKLGYLPSYTRTELTDKLHETFGFRTDYEIITDMEIKKIIRKTKNKKK